MHALTLIEKDPLLKPFEQQLVNRIEWYQNTKDYIEKHFGSLDRFASAHEFFGFQYDEKKQGWWFRDWLPNASYVSLIGDFNGWDRGANPLRRGNYGAWEIFLSDDEYKDKLVPGSKVKMHVHGENGQLDRIPAYIRQVVQKEDHGFDGVFAGISQYQWKNEFSAKDIKTPLIYEAHVGMATEEERVGTYREFAENILPRIKKLGYNCVQLMAIQEHPYYGSFGYQVSNYFAPSSRFGSPDDLRYLIDTAHGMGIAVILDVVHSHAVKNRDEGLAELDGTEQYFDGWQPDWDSRTFDYKKIEVKRFLASNLKYWMKEFKFDGFRFDGVTSMLYQHFGHVEFTDYSKYFTDTNNDAIIYLQLANELIHNLNPDVISICEDMSGMPGAVRPVEEGGLGFDYRLAMGLPDFWFTLLETKKDEDWHMGDLYWNLINRRKDEKNIAYAESHDQALVGDKTLAFWLMDSAMYTEMSIFNESLVVDRGIALHKMIRFITAVLGGEGYMNFMGNEFGHPEWIDFPRAENDWSYKYARRQWSLADTDHLKYQFLEKFDQEMISLIKEFNVLNTSEDYKLYEDNERKILAFRKADLIFVFNFGQESFTDFSFDTLEKADYNIILSSDDKDVGGFDRIDKEMVYSSKNHDLTLYLPSRTALVLKKKA
ncbi:alpha-amylase family glycosyl hydrolase [Weeksellaceae bacterium KMM 9713]|uniref:1,4-alpha-glucan branching enzyme n=1 Tax=Profundicola chukchiensis TaxID=2961959 RepID=A0A9X4RXB8_9FLAO|nr:alpha-amylase family glycosyl hydrolase [Profundicola chukchiensis]MDG4946094.1 alpha-amylase family glycosyl hydrolase [Profundicola chukchiensis]